MKQIILIFGLFISILGMASYAHASLPVIPAVDQEQLLKSNDPKLAGNKRLVFDFYRIILGGRRLELVSNFMLEDYMQHNPNVETGMKGFLDYFRKLGGPRPIPDQLHGLVSVQAEGDYVTLSFVNEIDDSNKKNAKYTTTWFDMFRIKNGKIAEHWDCDIKKK
ncbi:MAG: nuclear transport factor 2 family protein [Bdellovibrio sp.]